MYTRYRQDGNSQAALLSLYGDYLCLSMVASISLRWLAVLYQRSGLLQACPVEKECNRDGLYS